ncbi:protein transport protein Sec31A [Lates japonicus]|uniref:Protein transport protein Sec31A n=1 Tax=Lates japonicus TaxID=270547 RepID=A0AAD3R0S0_LATJO|nr:protein transport protein Sec31A [Lates japonicus]
METSGDEICLQSAAGTRCSVSETQRNCRTAIQSWSPALKAPPHLPGYRHEHAAKCRNIAQQLDALQHQCLLSFRDLAELSLDMKSCSFSSTHSSRPYCTMVFFFPADKLTNWFGVLDGMDTQGHPAGVVIAGGQNAILYDPAKIISERAMIIAESLIHTGPK